MITVHHLNNSRSQRILWLLEELEEPYDIVRYERVPPLMQAPPEMRKIHPVGKSPILTDGPHAIMESGAIVEYVLSRYGRGRLRPAAGSDEEVGYLQWMHYSEGSLMESLVFVIMARMKKDEMGSILPWLIGRAMRNLDYVESVLSRQDYLVGDGLTGADFQIHGALETAAPMGLLETCPSCAAYVKRLQSRPAYRRAIDRGGPYELNFGAADPK